MIASLKEKSSCMENYSYEDTESNQSAKPHNPFSWASPFGITKPDRMTMPPPMHLTSSIIPTDNNDQYDMRVCKYSNLTAININPSARHTSSYSSSFLRELEGTWTTDTQEEDEIRITAACHGNKWHAIVRALKSGTGVVPDWVIYQDNDKFTLLSMDGNVMAIMFRAMITKNCLTWFSVFGSKILWRRKGELPDECSSRSSTSTESLVISQMGSTSSGSSASGDIRPELCNPICNPEVPHCSSASNSSTLEAQRSISVTSPYSQLDEKLEEDDLLELFQNHCKKSPSLLQNILSWGISQTPNQSTNRLEIERLACGRLWVSAFLTDPIKKRKTKAWQIIDLKGAYELVAPGVYLQPPAMPGEPGAQHRLRKNNYGLWFIEKHDKEKDEWFPCIQELPSGKWIDLKNRKMYVVKVVSMLSILTRMTEQMADFGSMKKGMEFLFTSCNQKKLNANLKARSIKQRIYNLHVKLDKQLSLRFATRVATIADSIALENKAVCSKEKLER